MVIESLKSLFTGQRQRVGNFLSSVVFKVLTSLIYLIAIPLFIRSKGESSYAIVAIFLTIHGFISLLDAGFSYALGYRYTRALATSNPDREFIFDSGFSFYVMICGLIAVGTLFSVEQISMFIFGSIDFKFEVFVFVSSIMLLVLSSYFVVGLQAHEKLFHINLNRFLLDLTKGTGLLLIIYFNSENSNFVYYLFVGSILKLGMDYYFFSSIQPFHPKIDLNQLKANLKIGWVSIITSVLSFAFVMGDKILVIQKISKDIFGSYSFAVDLNARAYFMIYAVFSTVYPIMLKAEATGRDMKKVLLVSLAGIFVVTCIYYLPLFVFAKYIVDFFVDKNLNSVVVDLIRIFSIAAVGYMVFGLTETYLNSVGKAKYVLFCYLTGVSVFFLMITQMIDSHGVVGAAISFAVVNLLLALFGLCFSIFHFNLNKKEAA